jgi:hypothetical protein
MLEAGFSLGFCPAAFVWHYRRNTVKAYYGQQRGYGRAEAMLYLKYPDRFNALGQIKWRGLIPGCARMIPGGWRQRISFTRRHTDFQHVHDPALSLIAFLPLTLEWNLVTLAALAASYCDGLTLIPALAMMAAGPLWALYYARQAPLQKSRGGLGARLLIAWLAYSGPIARTLARYRYSKAVRRQALFEIPARQRPAVQWMRATVHLSYWNETWTTRETILARIGKLLARTGYPVMADGGWEDFDLAAATGPWTRIEFRSADEEHEGGRLKNHLAARVRFGRLGAAAIAVTAAGALGAAALGLATLAACLAGTATGMAFYAAGKAFESGRLAYRAIEQCAGELNLTALGRPTAAAIRAKALAPDALAMAKSRTSAEALQPASQ